MTREELEFLISQYLDGTLVEQERTALEARLASDPQAQAILRAEQALTAMLRSGPAAPQARLEVLAGRIWDRIDQQLEERVARASWMMRMRSPAFLTAVASIGLIAGISLHFLFEGRGHVAGPAQTVAMVFEGPQEDAPSGPAVTEVSIGPGGSYAGASSLAPYADEIDSRPTRVVIAAGVPAEETPAPSPY